ncbi:MAG: hypothetical protein Hyperionvirus48_5 [Hyperionvirus sp.]|uniref:Uncharacterized protein n=1 Tax=Hyperionvirus sp. TaxID=2487770 RepID=A0A3G5ACI6_9VIRU|nr:MAG: hypothetical protein Hyperionvirus48_5 [Hyperionvirus sp.]
MGSHLPVNTRFSLVVGSIEQPSYKIDLLNVLDYS